MLIWRLSIRGPRGWEQVMTVEAATVEGALDEIRRSPNHLCLAFRSTDVRLELLDKVQDQTVTRIPQQTERPS